MEITVEIDDDNLEPVVEGWADSNLDDRIQTYIENHDGDGSDRIESQIRGLLEDFTPGGGGCATARAFEEAVNGILDHRGELVLQPANDALNDALAEMVTKEVDKQVTIMVVNIQRGLRRLHSLDDAGGPEVAGAI